MDVRVSRLTVFLAVVALAALTGEGFAQPTRTAKPKSTHSGPTGRAKATQGGSTVTGARAKLDTTEVVIERAEGGAGAAVGAFTATDAEGNPVAKGAGIGSAARTENGAAAGGAFQTGNAAGGKRSGAGGVAVGQDGAIGAGSIKSKNAAGGSRSATGGIAAKRGKGAARQGKAKVNRANGSSTAASGAGAFDARTGKGTSHRAIDGTTKNGGAYSSDVVKSVDTKDRTASTTKTVTGTNADGTTKSATIQKEVEKGEGGTVSVENGQGQTKQVIVPPRLRLRHKQLR